MFKTEHWLAGITFSVFFLVVVVIQIALRPNPAVFPITIVQNRGGTVELLGRAGGVLLDNVRGYAVTAKHVATAYAGEKGVSLKAIIKGTAYPITLVWMHKTADIAIVKFDDAAFPDLTQITPLHVRSNPPTLNEEVRAIGWADPTRRNGSGCLKTEQKTFCQSWIDLKISMINVPMIKIAPLSAQKEFTEYSLKVGGQGETLAYEDLFFTAYLAAVPRSSLGLSLVPGMSGGGLVDEHNELLGVSSFVTDQLNAFIPAREIPEEYLPRAP